MRRTSDNKEFEEFPLIVSDSSVIATDIDNNLFCYKICELLRHVLSASYAESGSFTISSSYSYSGSHAISSSQALDALSASYSLSGSYVISASWAETSSFALEASAAFSAAFATSASHAIYADTASYAFFAEFASASISSSYAESASYGTNFYAPRVTASYVSSSFNVITNQLTASNALIRGTTVTTASWAVNAINAITAVAAGSASAALWAQTASLADTASYVTSTVDSASYARYADSASYGTNFLAPRITASFVSASVNTVTHNFTASNAYVDNITSYGQVVASNILANFIGATEVDADYSVIQQLTASNALVTGLMRGTASYARRALSSSYADWAQVASMSLGVLGLNVENAPSQPNSTVALVTRWAGATTPFYVTQSQVAVETRPHTAVKVNNTLYGGGWNGWIYVIKNPDEGLNNITSSSFIGGNYISQVAYSPETGYLYYLCGNNTGLNTGSIVRVDPNDIVGGQYNLIQGLAGSTTLSAFGAKDGYIYLVQSSQVRKYDAATGVLIGASASLMGGSHGGAVFSPDGQWGYVTAGSTVCKFNTTTLSSSYTSVYYFNGYGSFPAQLTDDMAYLNGYLYVEQDDISDFGLWKINADDLSWSWYGTTEAYPTYYGGFGVFTDGRHIYVLQRQEIWVYMNGNLDEGPIRFYPLPGRPNELWITDGNKFIYTDWDGSGMIYSYNLPITELGINTAPDYTLDIAGIINADVRVQSPTISASTTLTFGAGTQTGTLSWNGSARIQASPSDQGRLLVDTASLRVPTLSSSIALLGRADNQWISRSYGTGATPISITRSIWNIREDGMYRFTVAGTIAFYSGSTVTQPPTWSFTHTDRLGTYSLPTVPPELITVTNPAYDVGYAFNGDYVFQIAAPSTVSYYYSSNGTDPSSTLCSASFWTMATLTQILSGSAISASI